MTERVRSRGLGPEASSYRSIFFGGLSVMVFPVVALNWLAFLS